MANRPKLEDIVTPVGTLQYPNLNEPRDFEDDGNFKYDTKFILAGTDAEVLKGKINAITQEHLGKNADDLQHPVWEDVDDEERGEHTVFRFKVNAKGESKTGKQYDRKPVFLQADGTPYEMEEPSIGGGTRARISLSPYLWPKKKGGPLVGLTLQPRAVKVIELVERQRRDASYYASQMAEEESASGNPADTTTDGGGTRKKGDF